MGKKMTAVNPATATPIAEVECTPLKAVPEIYERARDAFGKWQSLSIAERIRYIRSFRLLVVEHLDQLVEAIAADTGKVVTEVLTTDIVPLLEAAVHVERCAKRELRPRKVRTPIVLPGKRSYVEYRPRGVVLVISPWNFPLQLSAVPALYALAAGNTVVIKPSEVTPYVGQWLERLFAMAGLPEGAVQVAHGDKDLGAALVAGRPDYIFFTGSARTGRLIQAEAARHLIPTTLELGGKDPMIVFADANLERSVQAALWGGLLNSGQVCLSVERIYVERDVYPQFVRRLVEEVRTLRQGTGPDDDIGSMTTPMQVEVVRRHVLDALQKGARLQTGLHPDEWNTEKGLFIPPMVLTDVRQDMAMMQEETFGPVLPVIPFDTEEEAIALANDSVYGLGASVWTADVRRGRRVAARLVTGNVLINDVVVSIANHNLPYGGEKDSGLGRYHGPAGLRTFCVETAVMVDRGLLKREINWFPYAGKYPEFRRLVVNYYGQRRRWISFLAAFVRLLRLSWERQGR